jgi:hypothetical protein
MDEVVPSTDRTRHRPNRVCDTPAGASDEADSAGADFRLCGHRARVRARVNLPARPGGDGVVGGVSPRSCGHRQPGGEGDREHRVVGGLADGVGNGADRARRGGRAPGERESAPTRVRRYLSRFLVVVVVALAIESLVGVVDALHGNAADLPRAASVAAAAAALLAAWGGFIRLNRSAEELEPEGLGEAKQEDTKVQ